MNTFDISKFLSYTVSVVVGGFGISVLLGLIPIGIEPPIRYIFGAVLILMAVYRFSMAKMKAASAKRKNMSDEGIDHFLMVLGFFFLLGGLGCQTNVNEETPTKGTLVVCVSESHQALIQKEADEFCASYPEAKVTVLPTTTREAFVHLLSDSVRMVITDREMNAEEKAAAAEMEVRFQQIHIAEDALAVLVNSLNALERISFDTLRAIVEKDMTDWTELPESGFTGPVETVLTGPNSGAYELVRDHFFDLTEDILPSVVLASQKEVLNYVAAHPQAIGLVSLACYEDSSAHPTQGFKGDVQDLAFSGFDSTGQKAVFKLHQANVYWGKYPLHYPVFIYFKPSQSKLATGFSGYVSSLPGQKIILNWGLVPAKMPIRVVQLT